MRSCDKGRATAASISLPVVYRFRVEGCGELGSASVRCQSCSHGAAAAHDAVACWRRKHAPVACSRGHGQQRAIGRACRAMRTFA